MVVEIVRKTETAIGVEWVTSKVWLLSTIEHIYNGLNVIS